MRPTLSRITRRNGLALIEAVHRQDVQAIRCLLDNCDQRLVAVFVANVGADLVTDLAEWWHCDEPVLFGRLRDHHAGGPPSREL